MGRMVVLLHALFLFQPVFSELLQVAIQYDCRNVVVFIEICVLSRLEF